LNQPRTVDLKPEGGLSILWDDGHRAIYGGRSLRLACRCALCKDEWTGERRQDPSAVAPDVAVRAVKPVGRYGLQIDFSDGHGTGIFTFDTLRGICECPICRPGSP
jgi:ATP-binding protein involved in chromosome partitioning